MHAKLRNNFIVTVVLIAGWWPVAQAQTNLYLWTRTWGGISNDIVHNVAVDGAGNVYVAGEFGDTVNFNQGSGSDIQISHGGQDAFLSKCDSDGNFLWARTWGGAGRDVASGLAVDAAGNAYVSGPFQNTVDFNPAGGETHSSNAGSMNNIFISKFAPDGT